MMNYLEFLKQVHEILKPRGYLEIGVRYGDSLKLASCPAIGIDPAYSIPGLDNRKLLQTYGNATLYSDTSDGFFAVQANLASNGLCVFDYLEVDLAFIDGMHLIENALRDFVNIERYANEKTIIIFDDVLPYSQAIAAREQPPGDWTGDVWKIIPILETFRRDLNIFQVDTEPTGLLVVTGFGRSPAGAAFLANYHSTIAEGVTLLGQRPDLVPNYIISREAAWKPDMFLSVLRDEIA